MADTFQVTIEALNVLEERGDYTIRSLCHDLRMAKAMLAGAVPSAKEIQLHGQIATMRSTIHSLGGHTTKDPKCVLCFLSPEEKCEACGAPYDNHYTGCRWAGHLDTI